MVDPDPPDETDDKVVIRDLARCEGWVEVRAKLKDAIILKSVLPADLVALRNPMHGDLLLQIRRIFHISSRGSHCGRPQNLEGRAPHKAVASDRL